MSQHSPDRFIGDVDRARANAHVADAIVATLCTAGVRDFFVAPGARSTPLVLALKARRESRSTNSTSTTSDDGIRVHIVVDERVAAYAALGAARASEHPAVVVTTSGTAVANLLPAVTEASLDHIPLVLVTADRPQGAFERGENQAIDQSGLLSAVTVATFDLAPAEACSLASVRNTVRLGVSLCEGPIGGPVHLNVRFEKPLVDTKELPRGEENGASPVPRFFGPQLRATDAAEDFVKEALGKSRRGLVVVGRLASDADRAAVADFIAKSGWPALACGVSGMPAPSIMGADLLVSSSRFVEEVVPDVVLWFGATLVSERVMGWMAGLPSSTQVIQIDPRPRGFDPFHAVTARIVAPVSTVAALSTTPPTSELADAVEKFSQAMERVRHQYLDDRYLDDKDLNDEDNGEQSPIRELEIARCVAASIDDGEALFVGASMPVRDLDVFSKPLARGARVFANRGASGIDGVLSCATGVALSPMVTTLLIGDVSILHDLSGMSFLAQTSARLRVVVIDNRGGAIFSFLPLARERPETVDPYFRSPPAPELEIEKLGRAMSIDVVTARTQTELTKVLATQPVGPELVVVHTDPANNVAEHDAQRRRVVIALDAPSLEKP